jgi:hypothetical protein
MARLRDGMSTIVSLVMPAKAAGAAPGIHDFLSKNRLRRGAAAQTPLA